MKKLRILLSALLICCLLPVGAGAADTPSQMQLTRQCIAHFQQERPSKGDNEWRIDEFVVSAWSLNEEKDIWELDISSIMSSTWSCAFEMQTGKIITPLINGQIFKRGEDSLLLETRTDEKYSYQVCDMKGGLRDISIPHDGQVVLADSEGYILSSFEVQKTVRTDGDRTMVFPLLQYSILDADGNVLLDELDDVYNDTLGGSLVFFDGEAAVRSGSTEVYVPDGPWPAIFYNAPYRFIDRSGKEIAQQKLDSLSYNRFNSRWFGRRDDKNYLLDGHGGESVIPYNWFEPSQWAEETVQQAAALGIELPYLSGHQPYRLNIRRDEFCTLAVQMLRAADPDKLPQTERAFPDCEDADVMRIAALGIVNGYEDGTFQPDRDISREEAAVILHRLYRVMYGEITADPVRYEDDSSIGLWAKESVYAMWQAGVMQGEGQNQFHPENGYTCEQAIATMLRMTMIEV